MPINEQTVSDLIRLGLKADAASIRRYARQLMRQVAKEQGSESGFCRQLSQLLAEDTTEQQLLRGGPKTVAITPPADVASLLQFEHDATYEAPILNVDASQALEQLIAERRKASILRDAGLEPSRTLLLVGPPGVGKTMAARFCAYSLGLPLVAIDLGSLMSSYLGRSGHNLRDAIEFARARPCVFLIDEFDAIAKRRDDPTDIGELKRIVNLLLLELDRWPSTGVLVAATNHPELLDRAIWRRFDRVIEVGLPDEERRAAILHRELTRYSVHITKVRLARIARAMMGASGSDIARMVQAAVRVAVLDPSMDSVASLEQSALTRLARDCNLKAEDRRNFCQLAHDEFHWTHRQIASVLGISHVMVGKMLKSPGPKPRSKRTPQVVHD